MSVLGLAREHAEEVALHLDIKGEAKSDLQRFTSAFFRDALPEELHGLDAAGMAEIAGFAWETAQARQPGQPHIRLESLKTDADAPGHRRTALCIINDDMPFLVDSVAAALASRSLTVDRIIHPVMDVRRDADGVRVETVCARQGPLPADGLVRESVLYIELERISARARQDLLADLEVILADVRAAVEDWQPMLSALSNAAVDLCDNPPPVSEDEQAEAVSFLHWLSKDNFTLLGYRFYSYEGDLGDETLAPKTENGLGYLRDPAYPVWRGPEGYTTVSPQLRHFLATPEPVLITKSNAMSTVHRRVHMDYVGVKAFRDGRVIGEHRFIGLFTSMSYAASARQVPLLRRKVEKVLEACGFDPRGHAGKALLHVLENFPRDEMFQIDPEQLTNVALGLLSLIDRPRPKLFVRRDRFERYVSVLTCIPRDLYRSDIRETVGRMLATAFHGRLSLYSVELRDDAMARVHFILGTTPGSVPHADEDDLNRRLRALVLGWDDQLETALAETVGEARAARLRLSHGRLLSTAYRAQYSPAEAALDIGRLIALRDEDDRDVLIYRRQDDQPHQIRLKIFSMGSIIPLSECVPVLEHLGLKVIEEYPFDLAEGKHGWIHDFLLADPYGQPLDLNWLKPTLEPALRSILGGDQEDDGFNALVIKVNLGVEQAGLFRAYFRYMRQIGLPYGQDTVQAALIGYPRLTTALADLFAARFDPNRADPEQEATILTDIENELARVEALADDRILRLYRSVILATVRTNAYQPDRPALAFKINSSQVPGLPLPVPYREIFVYSPRVEGIHLRGGKVARGGLRWSDRRDDFRTEVLSLLKAQMVKNAVIVPVGAKGGFYAKQLPPASDREAWLAEGKEAYKIFIRSLLTVTDNLVEGEVVPPLDVVRHDDDDPYLVVAADKGTATFSDIANGISEERGHWLGDAFASGGSKGYDHKAMGITARGGWISVERHFREMGINVATDPVRVVGVGDMSGDVFGNGMLLSRAIKLVAAFDHRHIFFDPTPDPEKSFLERQRLFNLPRSSWADYDPSLISQGGGVFPRTAKSIDLTPEIQAMLGVAETSLSPVELIRAVLKMEADLLWMGGIGTYVKAAAEPHAAAGDKANDPVRIDGEELRVKVVGEGANLGFTQGARIAFARKGGRINADFIDNSAGVDCSDNEVNIKILLNPIVASGRLPMEERDRLLEDMTDNVADIVLRDNYLQTQAISVAEIGGAHAVPAYGRLIQTLEASGHLNRAIEGLPSDEELERRMVAGEGLTRPELAVLLAYSKLRIHEALLDSAVLDDPIVQEELDQAFPPQLQERFPEEIRNHSLRRELIATKLSNAIVNRGGITIAFELAEETGAGLDQVVGAFVVAREVFNTRTLWRMIDSYDYRIPAEVQMRLHREAAGGLKRQIEDILRFSGETLEPTAMIARLKPGMDRLVPQVNDLLRPEPRARVEHYRQILEERGTPPDVREALILLVILNGGVGVALLAEELGLDEADIAHAYTLLGDRLGLDWAAGMAVSLMPADPWERLLLAGTAHDFERVRLEVVRRLVSTGNAPSAQAAVEDWLSEQEVVANRIRALVENVRASKPATTAKLTHLASQVRQQLSR
ncbi:MAG TPA: NAD-glutamate dehydrogenase [Pedomonas sp.]|uniref:NAD-glutamate dehydrogenase n=1 Tax=Pedomonas sp. TaxID=2976421 RepID=UPI002F3E333C